MCIIFYVFPFITFTCKYSPMILFNFIYIVIIDIIFFCSVFITFNYNCCILFVLNIFIGIFYNSSSNKTASFLFYLYCLLTIFCHQLNFILSISSANLYGFSFQYWNFSMYFLYCLFNLLRLYFPLIFNHSF
jgi:hypothetical protein